MGTGLHKFCKRGTGAGTAKDAANENAAQGAGQNDHTTHEPDGDMPACQP